MLSWNIRNDFISCLEEFVQDRIKKHISESTYYAIIHMKWLLGIQIRKCY